MIQMFENFYSKLLASFGHDNLQVHYIKLQNIKLICASFTVSI